jgi:hypothetical protein
MGRTVEKDTSKEENVGFLYIDKGKVRNMSIS